MKTPNKFRLRVGPMASNDTAGNNGAFLVTFKNILLYVIASDGEGWDHVSISLNDRTPTWEEMCFVKDLFFNETDCVVQFHPPKNEYVNNHNFCLHLWKPQDNHIKLPDSFLVGIK